MKTVKVELTLAEAGEVRIALQAMRQGTRAMLANDKFAKQHDAMRTAMGIWKKVGQRIARAMRAAGPEQLQWADVAKGH